MPNQGNRYAVHLDNLFTSSKLLTTLQEYGVGATGTVRTGQTWREVNDEKRQGEQSLHQLAQDKVKGEVEDEAEDEVEDEAEDEVEDETEDEDLDLDLDQDLHSFDDPNVQQQLDLLDIIIQDMYQSRNPQAQSHSQPHTTRAKKPEKEKNFGMNNKLLELKIKWSNHIAWGELYGYLSSDQKVLQLAWKDTQIVLFIITLLDASTTVSRLRKRPNK